MAVDSNLGAVVGTEEGAVERIPQRGENCPSEMCEEVSVSFWHSEGWTPRNEALMEAVMNFDGGSHEASENHQTPVVDRLWCKHVSRRFGGKLVVSK